MIVGGSMGYIKKQSLISLLSGGATGIAMIYYANDADIAGYTSLMLGLVFGYRFITGKKSMAAFISAFSIIVSIINFVSV